MSVAPSAERAAALFLELVDLNTGARAARRDALALTEPGIVAELDRLLQRYAEAAAPPDLGLALDAASVAGQRLGPFVLEREIGRGGMGTVWRAHRVDGQYTQAVAIKRLHAGVSGAQRVIERFWRERQTLAGLQHPHIAALLDGGVDGDGLPWFALELVEGLPITRFADQHQLAPAARVRLLLQALDAVQFAHQRLIVHRDLKPDNLLVTPDAQVKLLDFGIVKWLDAIDEETHTQTGARVYTPSYAAPEQVEGGPISVATDVYALGVILYELLAGQRPFGSTSAGSQWPQISAQWQATAPSKVLARDPQRARLARALRGDLDTIVLGCLARDPARRYPTVQALADDLGRYLAGRPILQRPDSAWYRAGKFVRRHPFGVPAVALGLGLLMALTAYSAMQARRAEAEAARAQDYALRVARERDRGAAEGRRQELLQEHYASVLNRALAAGAPIAPEALLELIAQPDLSASASDPSARLSIQLGIASLFIVRNDFQRAESLLQQLAPERARLSEVEQYDYAESLATAKLRLGEYEQVESLLDDGQRVAARLGEGALAARASLDILRAQWLRTRGDMAAAMAVAEQAVAGAEAAPQISAIRHGQVLVNAAQTAMAAGRWDRAESWASAGLARWAAAGLQRNLGYRISETMLGNLLLLRGQPTLALERFERMAAQSAPDENTPAAAARESSHARALSVLARHAQALALAQSASQRFCAIVGDSAPDCVRMRLVVVEVALAAGRVDLGQQLLAQIRAQSAAPALAMLAPQLQACAALLQLQGHPTSVTVLAADEALSAIARAGAAGPRSALRQRLGAAQRLLAADQIDLARQLLQPVLSAPEFATMPPAQGTEAALLALWRAQVDSRLPSAPALQALAEQLGDQHPAVLRWQSVLARR